jgi:glycyl-tRNA synthetase
MTTIENIVSLCKRRGFVYPSSEIYGGIGGFWDYGPMGVELARNIKEAWWKAMVHDRDDIVGLDASIIMNPKVWEASGHVASFTDPLVECKVCHARFRADQPDEIAAHEKAGHKVEGKTVAVSWTEPKQFNLLFRTFIGPVEADSSLAYLRGETCQGIYVNFQSVVDSTRIKVPFGIAQIGKAFRNEITPGKFIFRVREFEQMELEYFVHPTSANEAFGHWKRTRFDWHLGIGLRKENLRFRQHEPTERAHYAADSWDIEYNYPEWGYKELEGIANRTDYDLKTHSKYSGKDLMYRDPVTGEKYFPYVIEPSVGVSRLLLALLIDSYIVEEKRVYLKLKPSMAPYKMAIFPLVGNKPELTEKARDIYRTLKKQFVAAWDDRGNIGKRYLAQDEVGTPWCVTVDYDTLKDNAVTVRDRDTTKQERVSIDQLEKYFSDKLKGE